MKSGKNNLRVSSESLMGVVSTTLTTLIQYINMNVPIKKDLLIAGG